VIATVPGEPSRFVMKLTPVVGERCRHLTPAPWHGKWFVGSAQ
jgi:hypothetical protein